MNIVPDPKTPLAGTVLSPEANQAAALASATGVLTVDLDALELTRLCCQAIHAIHIPLVHNRLV